MNTLPISVHPADTEPTVIAANPARIVVCGVVYAANLGDGVIAECMSYVLKKHWPETPVYHLDLSTRENYGQTAVTGKRLILTILRNSPKFINRIIVSVGLKVFLIRKAVPAWENYFRLGDVIVVGGGHLLSDFNLNFPSKLELLTRFAKVSGGKIGLHAVGVSSGWSKRAIMLFDKVLSRCLAASVRDEKSFANLKQQLPSVKLKPVVARDPGYLAHLQYADIEAKGRGVGLNLSDPEELAQYDERGAPTPDYDEFWLTLIREYLGRGLNVMLFTNGAEEDEQYLNRIVAKAEAAGLSRFDRLPRPRVPAELVGQIKGLDLMIGHRLHAQIIAFTHGIPSIALGWDAKLQSQMELMGRGEFILPFTRPDAQQVMALGERAVAAPVDNLRIAELSLRAEHDLVSLVSVLASKR